MSIKDVAAYLGVSVRVLRLMLSNGQFPPPTEMADKTHRWNHETVYFASKLLANGWQPGKKSDKPGGK